MYLDQGVEVTRKFIHQYILSKLPEVLANKLYQDPKSRFQEIAQDKFWHYATLYCFR